MGDYPGLYLDALQVDGGQSTTPELWPALFAPGHFHRRHLSTTHRDVLRPLRREWEGDDWPEFHYFRADAAAVWERLSVLGYSEDLVRELWSESRAKDIEYYRTSPNIPAFMSKHADEMAEENFDAWCATVQAKAIGSLRLYDDTISGDPIANLAAKMIALRPKIVWADVTALYEEGHFSGDETLHTNLKRFLERADLAVTKILVLTEGRSDQRLIETALRAFYPNLADLYGFVDFEGFRVEGGASPAGRLLKGLAGAGVPGRVVALFDNDAAGHETLMSLRAVRFPPTIRALTLPPIDLAKRYPTIGPTGFQFADVNGSACAIELYLGRRSLTVSGSLLPVRWSQWNPKSERYQGELENKSLAADRFLADVTKGRSPAALRRAYPEMDTLLKTLFGVYS